MGLFLALVLVGTVSFFGFERHSFAAQSDVTITHRCAGRRGIIEASVTNRGVQVETFALYANKLSPRRSVIDPGKTDTLRVVGASDGDWAVRVNRSGSTLTSRDFAIECDPIDNQTGVAIGCLAGLGRVDAYVANEGPVTKVTNVVVKNSGTDFSRRVTIPAKAVRRATVTGLGNGGVDIAIDGFVYRGNVACSTAAKLPVVVQRLDVSRARTLPHESASFTQGLTFSSQGRLFESSGAYRGETEVREIDPLTGATLAEVGLGSEFFGEGLAAVGTELWLLSWKQGTVRVLDQDTLSVVRTYNYDGEGWGLCFDGASFVRSDGTSVLYRHRLDNFAPIEAISVTRSGRPVGRLNELACSDGYVWANQWFSDDVMRIDPRTGVIDLVIDVSALERPRPPDANAVPNGITQNPKTGEVWLTGKLWTTYYLFGVPYA